MPDRVCRNERWAWSWEFQEIVPTLERGHDNHRGRQKSLEVRHRPHTWRDVRNQLGCRILRFGKIAVHAGGKREKMKVVAVIHHSVNALLVRFAQKFFVRRDGSLVAMRRSKMVAHPRINMRRHMREMTFGGR